MSSPRAEEFASAAVAVLVWGAGGIVLIGPMVKAILERAAFHLGRRGCARVWPRTLAAAAWTLRHVCRRADAWPTHFRAYALADRGQTSAAAQAAVDLLATAKRCSPSRCPWSLVNSAVDVLVTAGRYHEATQAASRWSPAEHEAGRQADPIGYVYTQINTAEALHNQGRDPEALALLDGVQPQVQGAPLAAEGSKLLRAWILVHRGEGEAARLALGELRPDVFGPRYRAEMHYTLAAVERGLANLDEAWRQAQLGLTCARRAASRRNGLHALGAVAFARGDLGAAVAHLEAFAGDAYQGQSSAGLLLLGQALERTGRIGDARIAYRRAIDRDGGAAWAHVARERLAHLGA
jgi:tetratricopeptide (TPR) repeat protein